MMALTTETLHTRNHKFMSGSCMGCWGTPSDMYCIPGAGQKGRRCVTQSQQQVYSYNRSTCIPTGIKPWLLQTASTQ